MDTNDERIVYIIGYHYYDCMPEIYGYRLR